MTDTTEIVMERTKGNRIAVRAVPHPLDGTYCADTFTDKEKAEHFAWQLRRARGWPIRDLTAYGWQAGGPARRG